MRAMLRLRTALVAALTLIVTIAIPIATSGTAQAASCNTAAKSSWYNNCTVSTSSYSHSNFTVVIQVMVQIYDQDSCGPLIALDGYYGSDTANAVKCWQAGHKLSVDGVVGPQTWTSFMNALSEYTDTGGWYYYVSQYNVDFRENVSTGVWQYGGPYAGSQWTPVNSSVPPVPIWVDCCS